MFRRRCGSDGVTSFTGPVNVQLMKTHASYHGLKLGKGRVCFPDWRRGPAPSGGL